MSKRKKPAAAPAAPQWPADRVERRRVELLKVNPRNPKVHSSAQIDEIVELVRTFGWTQPIVVDEDDLMWAGHGRLAAAQRMGLAEVPVVVLRGVPHAKKRALLIADNKVPTNAEWNNPLLREELAFLQAEGGEDLINLAGFQAEDLVTFLATGAGATPPSQFPILGENIATEYCCPRCGYEWSGQPRAGTPAPPEGEAAAGASGGGEE